MLTENGGDNILIPESVATLKIKQICLTLLAGKSKLTAFVLIGNQVNLM